MADRPLADFERSCAVPVAFGDSRREPRSRRWPMRSPSPQYGVSPPSALIAWPRMIMASSLKRKEIVRATSTGSMCRMQLRTDELGKDLVGRRVDEPAVGDRDLAQHVGRHPARADAIDVDVVRRERRGEDPGHVDQRRLAGAVGEQLHVPLLARLRGDADDRAARARGDHRLGDEPRRLVGAEEVDAENPLPIRPGRLERIGVDDDRGAIDEAVERPSRASAAATAPAIEAGSARSSGTAKASALPVAATAASSASARMSASATRAPSAASSSAVARPTPPAAPVTRMSLPSCFFERAGSRTGSGRCGGRVENWPMVEAPDNTRKGESLDERQPPLKGGGGRRPDMTKPAQGRRKRHGC